MGIDANLGRAVLDLVTNPALLRAGLAAARAETLSTLRATQASLHSIGAQMTTTGMSLTKGITVPVLAAGAAIFKVASDFETDLSHIVGLVGIGRDEVNAWVPEIEALGVATGKGPSELARGLYFITSAGLRGQDALDALTASAKASAAGLGDTAIVADAVTSAVNSYAKSGLTASQATDVLVAAVRDGKTSAADLAPTLGRLLPVAAALGINFAQVGGTLAVMTRVSGDAAGAATSLNAIMSTLLKPSKEAQTTLAGVGISMADLRAVAAEEPDGLYRALQMLDGAFGDNEEALAKVVPNVRAFRGVLAVLGQDASVVEGVLKDTANATGLTDKAFEAVAEDAGFKADQAMSRLADDLIRLGKEVLPVVVSVLQTLVGWVHQVTDWFTGLPQPVQATVVQVLALAAALGPILVLGGAIVGALSGLLGAFIGLGSFLATTLVPFVVGALTAAWTGFATLLFATDIPALMALGVAMVGVEVAAGPLLILLGLLAGAVVVANVAYDDSIKHLAGLRAEGKLTEEQLRSIAYHMGKTPEELTAAIDAYDAVGAAATAAADAASLAIFQQHANAEREGRDLPAALAPVAKSYEDIAAAAAKYAADQKKALTKALTDERTFTANALTTMRKFRTDLEGVFAEAKSAALDASDTALAIAEKQAELAKGDKEYRALKHATALQTAEYKNRRAHILAELAELKLHAALIGDDMHKATALDALLTSKDMEAGLTSKMPETKAAYEALRDSAVASLNDLASRGGPAADKAAKAIAKWLDPDNPLSALHDAGAWGTATGNAYIDNLAGALRDGIHGTGGVVWSLGKIAKIMAAGSPPGPESPLHEIDRWGDRTGWAWALPLVRAIGSVPGMLAAPLGAIGASLQFGSPRLALAAGALGAGATPGQAPAAGRAAPAGAAGMPNITLYVDARGHDDPKAFGDAARQAVGDAMAGVFRDQLLRGDTGVAS